MLTSRKLYCSNIILDGIKMKKLLALFGVLFVSSSAYAVWLPVVASESGSKYFVDPETIKKGKMARAWFLSESPTVSRYGDRSGRELIEADCKEGRLRNLSHAIFSGSMGSGSTLAVDNKPSEWSYVAPNTVNEDIFRLLCSKTR